MPYKVTAPRKELDLAPEVLRTYLRYLDVTGLRDPRGATFAEAEEIIAGALAEYAAALDDPTLRGLATFWAHTALHQGVDLTVPGAFERFKRDLDAGRVPYDVGMRELRELVAEPLRRTARHPLRLVPTRPPGARGRRKKRKH